MPPFIQFVIDHWGWFAGGGTILTTALGWVVLRLKPDQQAYTKVLQNVDQAARSLDAIVGRPVSQEKDCEQCRSVSASRRQIGHEIRSMLGPKKYPPFSRRLTAFGTAMRDVEDLIQNGASQAEIRAACDSAILGIDGLRSLFCSKTEGRLSIMVHGRHGPPPKP